MNIRVLITSAALALSPALAAQLDNPQEKIRELAHEIATEMQEIDKLLLQTRPQNLGAAAENMRKTSERIDKLLEQTSKSQKTTIKRIDELIAEIEKLGGS